MDSISNDNQKVLIEKAKQIQRIQNAQGNETCADCYLGNPEWASLLLTAGSEGKFGVLLCQDCAVHHVYEVGRKRCIVKHLPYLHEWTFEELDILLFSGNALVNNVYEASMTKSNYDYYYQYQYDGPENDANEFDEEYEDDMEDRQAEFIRNKYKRRAFQDHEAMMQALEKVDQRRQKAEAKADLEAMEEMNKQLLGHNNNRQDEDLDKQSERPKRNPLSSSNLTSMSLRGTKGEVKATYKQIKKASEKSMGSLWNSVTSLAPFSGSHHSLNSADSLSNINSEWSLGGEEYSVNKKISSKSVRGTAGEAKSRSKELDKVCQFVDMRMLMLDDELLLDDMLNTTSILEFFPEDEASVMKPEDDSESTALTVATRVSGTSLDSWDSQHELLEWIGATTNAPQAETKPKKDRRRRFSASSRKSSCTTKSSSRPTMASHRAASVSTMETTKKEVTEKAKQTATIRRRRSTNSNSLPKIEENPKRRSSSKTRVPSSKSSRASSAKSLMQAVTAAETKEGKPQESKETARRARRSSSRPRRSSSRPRRIEAAQEETTQDEKTQESKEKARRTRRSSSLPRRNDAAAQETRQDEKPQESTETFRRSRRSSSLPRRNDVKSRSRGRRSVSPCPKKALDQALVQQ